jgi:hypothetical protein
VTGLDDTEREAMARAAPAWAARQMGVYEIGWLSSRSYQQARIGELKDRESQAWEQIDAITAHALKVEQRVEELEGALRELEDDAVLNSAAGLLAMAMEPEANLRNSLRASIKGWLEKFDLARTALRGGKDG